MFQNELEPTADTESVEELEDVHLSIAEVYSEYKPAKLHLGCKHPDSVVETSSLSSVESPDISYHLSLPESTIESGSLSGLQLESVVYASQQHENYLPNSQRSGFLIGDGAGVGKGRQLAGIIYENYLNGRCKSLWISVSADLKYDVQRDLSDIGANISVYPLVKFKYAPIASEKNGFINDGVIFVTYSSLISESSSTFSPLKSRFDQIVQWCGPDFEGVIVFDECHRAKNICPAKGKPTKTGLKVVELQTKLPKARVVYASATGASEIRNMAYMIRLGLWGEGTPFKDFDIFKRAVDKRGVGALELVAMDMKLRGLYIARQLSFQGVSFVIDEVALSPDFISAYNESVELWAMAKKYFDDATKLVDTDCRMMWAFFWGAHQRFFKYLCIGSKIKHAVKVAKEALEKGKCVVIGLQSTGEAQLLGQMELYSDFTDFICTPKGVFESLVSKHFPSIDQDKGMKNKSKLTGIIKTQVKMRADQRRKQVKPNDINLPRQRGRRNNSTIKKNNESIQLNNRVLITDHAYGQHSGFEYQGGPSKRTFSDHEICDTDTSIERVSKRFPGKRQKRSNIPKEEVSPKNLIFEKKSKRIALGTKTSPVIDLTALSYDEKVLKFSNLSQPTFCNTSDSVISISDSESDGENNLRTKSVDMCNTSYENNVTNLCSFSQFTDVIYSKKKATKDDDCIQILSSSVVDKDHLNNNKAKMSTSEKVESMKNELLSKIDDLSLFLPKNTLDELIHELGGPECVAEMTGRRGRLTKMNDYVKYESREFEANSEDINVMEKELFMNGVKNIAVISEASSSGISLHSDKRSENQKQRVHITLELPWSADRAVQQFGRTHRSNQLNAPEYIFLISDLAGEKRFASSVAKRLESLGALTHGDRRVAETLDLSSFHIDNSYGKKALNLILNAISGNQDSHIPLPDSYPGDFKSDMCEALVNVGIFHLDESNVFPKFQLTNQADKIDKFFNRLLGIRVDLQNTFFKYFSETLDILITNAIQNRTYDLGILDMGDEKKSRRIKTVKYYKKYSSGVTTIDLHTVIVDRGMSFDEALDCLKGITEKEQGFYLSHRKFHKRQVVLVKALNFDNFQVQSHSQEKQFYFMCKPHLGKLFKKMTLREIEANYKLVTKEEAMEHWEEHYNSSERMCCHLYLNGHCKSTASGLQCEFGIRKSFYYLLSGSILSILSDIEDLFGFRLKLVRLKMEDGLKVVGIVIPKSSLPKLKDYLISVSEKLVENDQDC